MSVVLPAPFSPTRAWISPGDSSKVTWSLATMPPKRRVMSRSATTGVDMAGEGSRGALDPMPEFRQNPMLP